MEYFIILGGTIIASGFGTITGFGVATLLMPFAAFFLDFREALLFVALIHFAAALSRFWVFRKGIDWEVVVHFAVPNLIFAALGALVATQLPIFLLRKFFAAALFFYAVFGLVRPQFKLPRNRPVFWGGGTLTGLSAGLVGMGGAVRSAILASMPISKKQYLAASGAIPLIAEFGRSGVYLLRGVRLDKEFVVLLPFLALVSYITVFLVEKYIRHISPAPFRLIVFLALMAVAVYFFFGS